MNKHLNEKGSMPIVLIIVFVMTMSVVALTSLSLSEKINLSYSATKDLENLYQEDAVIESVINATYQVVTTKLITQVANQNFLEDEDYTQVEMLVNGDFIPNFELEGYQVFIADDYSPPTINYFCSEKIEESNATFAGFDCLHEPFEVNLLLQIEKNGNVVQFVLALQNLYPKVNEDGETIRIDLSGMEYALYPK